MSCASSCWGAVISERSLLLCHRPCWYSTFTRGQSRQRVQEIRTQVPINLLGGAVRKLFPCLIPGAGVGGQVKEQIFGILEWSTVCFYQGHPESMKWNLRMQNKSQISLPVTVKTPFSPFRFIFFFQMHILGCFFFFFFLVFTLNLERLSLCILPMYVLWPSAQPWWRATG